MNNWNDSAFAGYLAAMIDGEGLLGFIVNEAMAVPVMRWMGERIQAVEGIIRGRGGRTLWAKHSKSGGEQLGHPLPSHKVGS